MKCTNCHKEIDNNVNECPFCHTPLESFELPKLKEEKKVNKKEIIIEEPSNEKLVSEDKLIEEPSTDNNFSSNDNVKMRKSFFKRVILVTILICLIVVIIFYLNKNSNSNVSYDQELNNYYNSYSIEDAKELLDVINNNDEVIVEVQNKTKDKLYLDIENIKDKTYTSRDILLKQINKLKEEINDLYNLYVLNKKKDKIKVISSDTYDNLMIELDKLDKDSELYYLVIDFYKDKEYNEVARLVNSTKEDNNYYKQIYKYLDLVISDVLNLIELDIEKMSNDIDLLNEEDKKIRYNQIYLVIDSYNKLYSNLNLINNSKYQELLINYNK